MPKSTDVDIHPPYLFPEHQASVHRAPTQRLVRLPRGWFYQTRGPVFGRIPVRANDNDLLHQHAGDPLGQRIVSTTSCSTFTSRETPRALARRRSTVFFGD
jgi:protocatechuate 3,4-dioxygenase beta subunit